MEAEKQSEESFKFDNVHIIPEKDRQIIEVRHIADKKFEEKFVELKKSFNQVKIALFLSYVGLIIFLIYLVVKGGLFER